jgi:hypothetical protein
MAVVVRSLARGASVEAVAETGAVMRQLTDAEIVSVLRN